MSDSMVERVARTIGEYYDGLTDPVATPENWARALGAARAAIAAMREPTAEMQRKWNMVTDEHTGFQEACPLCGGHLHGWRIMIDAALSSSDTSTT